ncbi:MAG: hypothetical protein ACRDTG_07100 [Pseudonocardiaceae bacterium]
MSATTAELLEDLLDAQAIAEAQAGLCAGTEGRRRLVSADQVADLDDLG